MSCVVLLRVPTFTVSNCIENEETEARLGMRRRKEEEENLLNLRFGWLSMSPLSSVMVSRHPI